MVVLLRVEEIASRLLDLLVKLKHFDDVGLLPTVARSSLMRMLLLSLLITKEVVLGLVIDVLSLLVVAARDPVLVHLLIWLLSRLIRCVCHNDFNSFKVFSTGSNPLDEL